MITLYTDRKMIAHKPPTGHPERPERLAALLDHWAMSGHQSAMLQGVFAPVKRADLVRVHTQTYLNEIKEKSNEAIDKKIVKLDPDTYLAESSILAAELAAGATVAAVKQVVEGKDDERIAFCAIRPPGHHARPDHAMGFCIYANASVAAAYARDVLGLDRILIVDFDVHHGNGTQEIFYEDDRVGFLSIHRFPFYPGTGDKNETGRGRGLGFTWNVPLASDTPRSQYLDLFRKTLDKAAEKMKPQLVIVSAGFDAHRLDPVGGLNLESEDFASITKPICEVAREFSHGRILSLLEGGYNIEKLVESATIHIESLGARPKSE